MSDDATDTAARPRRPRALRHWRVRTKVIAVLLVPVLLALVLAAITVRSQTTERASLERVVEGTRLARTTTAVVEALQVERALAATYVAAGRRGDRPGLDAAMDRTNASVTELEIAGATVADLAPGVQDRFAVALARLEGLDPLRTTALASAFPATSVVTAYTGVIEPVLALTVDVADAEGDAATAGPAAAAAALGQAKEQAERQHAILSVAASTNDLPGAQGDALRAAQAEQAAAEAAFDQAASSEQLQLFDDTVAGPAVDQRLRLLQTALLRGTANQPLAIAPAEWDAAAGATRAALREVEVRLLDDLASTAEASVTRATTALAAAIVLVALGLVLAIALALLVARSLLAPLQALRTDALDIARRRLPEAIERIRSADSGPDTPVPVVEGAPIDTEEEIGELGRAFDSVHREAVRLASEQARLRANLNDLFVNLSRRSQSLVERQLMLIDELEGREDDPDVLANLFQLDHLATRMRRNGENLLVLGGAVLARGATAPMEAPDVVRAAAGEVEQYRRIVQRPVPGLLLLGEPATDLTHLLAELLDNATTYSPPDTTVVVTGSRAPDGGLIVEIADEGVGMDAEDLDAANAKLEEPPPLDAAMPRRMGLFVVGALARRHGIVARLLRGHDGGTTAIVAVPASAVLAPGPRPMPTDGEVPAITLPAPRPPRPVLGPSAPATVEAADDADDAPPEVATVDALTDSIPIPASDDADPDGTLELIYTELQSAWFREHPPDADAPDPGSEAAADDGSRPDGDAVPVTPRPREPVDAGAPGAGTGPAATAWASPADEGWEAVATAASSWSSFERTAVGLPQRRRGALLVPGAAGPGPGPEAGTDTHDRVDADALRSRMSRYQQGMHRARQAVGAEGDEQDTP